MLAYPNQMSLNRDIIRNFKYKWNWKEVSIKEENRVRAITLPCVLCTMYYMANRVKKQENIKCLNALRNVIVNLWKHQILTLPNHASNQFMQLLDLGRLSRL